jgi:membrane protein
MRFTVGLRRIVLAAFRPLRGRDVSLHAAAVTFYGGIAVVPVALLAIWLSGLVAGAGRVRRLTSATVEALPGQIGADRALAALLEAGLELGPGYALAALLPATLYGEGLRRAFVNLSGPGETLVGWRGRLLILPLLAAAPALVLSLLAALPLATNLVTRGGWIGFAGVTLSFLTTWLLLSPVVVWVYRAVAPGRPRWRAALPIGSFTAANLSGFLHGAVLFCALPIDLGVPFGGFTAVGAAVAVCLWLYLLHVILLAGFAATRVASAWLDDQTATVSRAGTASVSAMP